MSSEESSYQELYDRVNKTAKSRFNAQSRLGWHNSISLFSIILFSICLLIVPLAKAYNIELNAPDNIIELVQLILTIAILIISTVISMAGFAVRSEKFHTCGKELNHLLRIIEPHKAKKTDDEYINLCEKYETILSGYENHKNIDYKRMILEMKTYYKPSWYDWCYTKFIYLLEFSPYSILLLLAAFWVAYILI